MNSELPEEDGEHQPGRSAKSELVDAVANAIDIESTEAARIVDVIFSSIVRALQSGDRVELRGFGVFGVRERNSRTGRNPKTGAAVAVPAKRVAFFAASKSLLKDLNRHSEV
jgi:integration host factor subunit beta